MIKEIIFNKYQWDIMHDPGIITGLFESDTSGMKVNKDGFTVQETLRILRLKYKYNFDYTLPIYAAAENIKIGNNKYSLIQVIPINHRSQKEITKDNNIIYYDNIQIISSKEEVDKLYDFIIGKEENIYGLFNKKVNINGEDITFEKVINQIETLMVDLLKKGKYNDLTYEERIALNVPIIEWKLGYYYGAAFIYYWFKANGKNINLTDGNFNELFLKSEFFKKQLKEAKESIPLYSIVGEDITSCLDCIYQDNFSKTCLSNIKKAMIENRSLVNVPLPNDYDTVNKQSSNYISLIKIYPVSFLKTTEISSNQVINDDFAYAMGSFAFNINMKNASLNMLEKNKATLQGEVYYRIWDGFDFQGEQRLGNWNGDIFEVSSPSLAFTNYTLYNATFQGLYEKISGQKPKTENGNEGITTWDFNVVTKYYPLGSKLKKINFSIDILGHIFYTIE